MHMKWVNIGEVLPNPLNPRKDYSTKTKEMQNIIKEKGWETGITCYKKESKYVILSGHRRWFAANQLGTKNIPILVVAPPLTDAEELERLGSIQGGKVDWSVYEWAKYTYEMWILWDKCSYSELAHKMGTSSSYIASRIKVFTYFPHDEIEEKLEKGTITISVLYYLVKWLENLKKKKLTLVFQYKEELIRKTMLQKIEMGLVNVTDLKNDMFIELSSDEQMKDFLMSKKKLSDSLKEVSLDASEYRNVSRINSHIKKINRRTMKISQMDAESGEEAEILVGELNILRLEIKNKQSELIKFLD